MAQHGVLNRPNTIRFCTRQVEKAVTPEDVYNAVEYELDAVETIKCIAEIGNKWFNVTFDNGTDCQTIAAHGILLQNTLIQCERTNVANSVVVYVKCPYEMSDQVVTNTLSFYGTVANIRRQFHDFDRSVETGVRSFMIKSLKKPIPSFLRVGGFTLPVRYRGQVKTCKICEQTDHLAYDCPARGRCFVCGSHEHRAVWHDRKHEEDVDSGEMEEGEVEQPKTADEENKDNTTDEEEDEQEEKTPKPEENDNKESQAQEQQKTHKKPTPEETRTTDKRKVSETEKQQKTYKPTPEKTPTQQKTADQRNPEESRKTSKSYKDIVVGKQPHRKEKVKTGFWDEHVATTRKRKEREEGDVHSRKQAREDENDDEATVMDIEDAPPSETEDPPPSEIENMPSDHTDGDDDDDGEWVPYTRRGVQRFRRKRGTGGITLQNRSLSQSTPERPHTSKPSQPRSSSHPIPEKNQTPSYRGRGRGQKNN